MKISFTSLLPLFLVMQLGCQTTKDLQIASPSEFPTININDTLHIEVQEYQNLENLYGIERNNIQMYLIFKDALLDAFKKLEYPGEIIVNRWPSPSRDTAPHIHINVLGWGLDKDRDGYRCTITASLSYIERETDLGRIVGEDSTYTSINESSALRERGYRLSAEDAFKEFFRRYLRYTNAQMR